MQDILIGGLFLVVFGLFMRFVYRIIGDDAEKVHGCHAGGMLIKQEEEEEKSEVNL
jgi:hypothetical protein